MACDFVKTFSPILINEPKLSMERKLQKIILYYFFYAASIIYGHCVLYRFYIIWCWQFSLLSGRWSFAATDSDKINCISHQDEIKVKIPYYEGMVYLGMLLISVMALLTIKKYIEGPYEDSLLFPTIKSTILNVKTLSVINEYLTVSFFYCW